MIILGFLPFVMVIGNSMFIPILPTIEMELGINSAQTGLLLTVFSIPAALIIPFTGFFANKFGRKKIILISLFLVGTGSILSAVSPFIGSTEASYALLIIGRVIQGLGAGGTAPLAMTLVGDLFTAGKRSKALGTIEVFNGLGKMLSPFFGIIAVMIVWHSAFWFYLLLVTVTFLGILTYVNTDKPTYPMSIKQYRNNVKAVLTKEHKWLLPVFFTGGVILFILFGLLVYLSYEAEMVYLVNGMTKGILFAVPLGVMTICSYFSGRYIGDDVGRVKIMVSSGLGLMLVVLIGGMLQHSFVMLVIMMTFFSAGAGFLLPCCNLFVTSNVSKEDRGSVVSLYGMVRFMGVALGPLIYSQWMYNEWWMFMYSFLLLIGAVIWLYVGWLALGDGDSLSTSPT